MGSTLFPPNKTPSGAPLQLKASGHPAIEGGGLFKPLSDGPKPSGPTLEVTRETYRPYQEKHLTTRETTFSLLNIWDLRSDTNIMSPCQIKTNINIFETVSCFKLSVLVSGLTFQQLSCSAFRGRTFFFALGVLFFPRIFFFSVTRANSFTQCHPQGQRPTRCNPAMEKLLDDTFVSVTQHTKNQP